MADHDPPSVVGLGGAQLGDPRIEAAGRDRISHTEGMDPSQALAFVQEVFGFIRGYMVDADQKREERQGQHAANFAELAAVVQELARDIRQFGLIVRVSIVAFGGVLILQSLLLMAAFGLLVAWAWPRLTAVAGGGW